MKKLLVLSDVHANYPALKAIENHVVNPDRFDRIVNAGDLTVYSTFPNETIEWFRRRTKPVCIAGNTVITSYSIHYTKLYEHRHSSKRKEP